MKVNKHGQVLVSFILILPVILLILAVVVDLGMLLADTNNLNNLASNICKYSDKDDQTLKSLLLENDKSLVNIVITRDKDKITEVSFQKEKKAVFGKIVGYKESNIKIKNECKRG